MFDKREELAEDHPFLRTELGLYTEHQVETFIEQILPQL